MLCSGVIPVGFSYQSGNQYLSGARPHAWCLTGGNGYKCHRNTSGVDYCEPVNEGDTVGVEVDFEAKTVGARALDLLRCDHS